jgi:hypothetical protein
MNLSDRLVAFFLAIGFNGDVEPGILDRADKTGHKAQRPVKTGFRDPDVKTGFPSPEDFMIARVSILQHRSRLNY